MTKLTHTQRSVAARKGWRTRRANPLRSQDFTPRARSVMSRVMRDAYMRNRGEVPPERRMRFNPRKRSLTPHQITLSRIRSLPGYKLLPSYSQQAVDLYWGNRISFRDLPDDARKLISAMERFTLEFNPGAAWHQQREQMWQKRLERYGKLGGRGAVDYAAGVRDAHRTSAEMSSTLGIPNPAKPHTEVMVSHLPDCDICEMEGYRPVGKARYDFRMRSGHWAYGCPAHFRQHGIKLGLGFGQKLVLRK